MAVSPDILVAALRKKVEAAEKTIDQRLSESVTNIDFSGKITISGRGIDYNMIETLRPRYLAAGWTGMQRNTDYYGDLTITFSFKVDTASLLPETQKAQADVSIGKRKITLDR